MGFTVQPSVLSDMLSHSLYSYVFENFHKKFKKQKGRPNRILLTLGKRAKTGKKLHKILTGTQNLVVYIIIFHSYPIFILSGIISLQKVSLMLKRTLILSESP